MRESLSTGGPLAWSLSDPTVSGRRRGHRSRLARFSTRREQRPELDLLRRRPCGMRSVATHRSSGHQLAATVGLASHVQTSAASSAAGCWQFEPRRAAAIAKQATCRSNTDCGRMLQLGDLRRGSWIGRIAGIDAESHAFIDCHAAATITLNPPPCSRRRTSGRSSDRTGRRSRPDPAWAAITCADVLVDARHLVRAGRQHVHAALFELLPHRLKPEHVVRLRARHAPARAVRRRVQALRIAAARGRQTPGRPSCRESRRARPPPPASRPCDARSARGPDAVPSRRSCDDSRRRR